MKLIVISSLLLSGVYCLPFQHWYPLKPQGVEHWPFERIYENHPSNTLNRPVHTNKAGNIFDVLSGDKRFVEFMKIINGDEELKNHLTNSDQKITLFAPINKAFDKIPGGGDDDDDEPPPEELRKLILYHTLVDPLDSDSLAKSHVLDTFLKLPDLNDRAQVVRIGLHSKDLYVNHGKVIAKDIQASNGIIHAVDQILLPPFPIFTELNMVPTIFSTFTSAIHLTNMGDDIRNAKGVTLFAPINKAWEKLGYQKLAYLFSPKGQSVLRSILEYHISPNLEYTRDIFKDGKEVTLRIPTWNEAAEVEISGHLGKHRAKLQVNGETKVLFTDVLARNGVAHIIDQVLVPPKNNPKYTLVNEFLNAMEDDFDIAEFEPFHY
ncbi:hypothetical protein K7432_006810 [Basidiobolus ranarum]|uniref:FAS1 domain-containing protein n=1 Tax=Basidiobolus ranarum TaxID=34480 RepID=A0ABR2WU96_9FUNG